MTLFIFDLDQLPTLPLAPGGKIPFATAYVLEISCLQGMQARSSFALDARGIYLADWDKGYPDEHLAYEPLHLGHQLRGEWPDEIRPNCKLSKGACKELTDRGLYQDLDGQA
jgi:hypothetical protein